MSRIRPKNSLSIQHLSREKDDKHLFAHAQLSMKKKLLRRKRFFSSLFVYVKSIQMLFNKYTASLPPSKHKDQAKSSVFSGQYSYAKHNDFLLFLPPFLDTMITHIEGR